MRVLKWILFIVLGLIALALIIAAFVDGKMNYEKSITIAAPPEKVWTHVNSLTAMNAWNPWMGKDPAIKTKLEGTDGTPGATFSWEGNKEVGKGSQTIKSLKPNELVETDLKFFMPYESEAQAHIKLAPEGAGTKVTWGFASEMPYPFRIMKLCMNMDKMMDADYTRGLNSLKQLSEAP